jgi:hypothetical protein
MALLDIKKVQEEAEAEVAKEEASKAKESIKAHLKKIAAARAVVSNLEREYEVLLRTVAA